MWWIIQQNFSLKYIQGRNVEVETRYVHGPYSTRSEANDAYDKYVDMYGPHDFTLVREVMT